MGPTLYNWGYMLKYTHFQRNLFVQSPLCHSVPQQWRPRMQRSPMETTFGRQGHAKISVLWTFLLSTSQNSSPITSRLTGVNKSLHEAATRENLGTFCVSLRVTCSPGGFKWRPLRVEWQSGFQWGPLLRTCRVVLGRCQTCHFAYEKSQTCQVLTDQIVFLFGWFWNTMLWSWEPRGPAAQRMKTSYCFCLN